MAIGLDSRGETQLTNKCIPDFERVIVKQNQGLEKDGGEGLLLKWGSQGQLLYTCDIG